MFHKTDVHFSMTEFNVNLNFIGGENALAVELVHQVCERISLDAYSVIGAGNQYIINRVNLPDNSIMGKVWFTFFGADSLDVMVGSSFSTSKHFNLSNPDSFKAIEDHVKSIFGI